MNNYEDQQSGTATIPLDRYQQLIDIEMALGENEHKHLITCSFTRGYTVITKDEAIKEIVSINADLSSQIPNLGKALKENEQEVNERFNKMSLFQFWKWKRKNKKK